MHEFVASAHTSPPMDQGAYVATGLLERDFYAPHLLPAGSPRAIMVEPTETESKATLDAFAEHQGDREAAREEPKSFTRSHTSLPVGRLDEVATARRSTLLQGQSDDRSSAGSRFQTRPVKTLPEAIFRTRNPVNWNLKLRPVVP